MRAASKSAQRYKITFETRDGTGLEAAWIKIQCMGPYSAEPFLHRIEVDFTDDELAEFEAEMSRSKIRAVCTAESSSPMVDSLKGLHGGAR